MVTDALCTVLLRSAEWWKHMCHVCAGISSWSCWTPVWLKMTTELFWNMSLPSISCGFACCYSFTTWHRTTWNKLKLCNNNPTKKIRFKSVPGANFTEVSTVKAAPHWAVTVTTNCRSSGLLCCVHLECSNKYACDKFSLKTRLGVDISNSSQFSFQNVTALEPFSDACCSRALPNIWSNGVERSGLKPTQMINNKHMDQMFIFKVYSSWFIFKQWRLKHEVRDDQ